MMISAYKSLSGTVISQKIKHSFLILPLFLLGLNACDHGSQKSQPLVFTGITMGTTYSIKVVGPLDSKETKNTLEKDIIETLKQINKKMSIYDPDSEISRFNRFEDSEWFKISEETASVIECAINLSARTGGAFDITIGPLVNLWGFGPEKPSSSPPSHEMVARMKAHVGYHLIELRKSPPGVRKKTAAVYIDLAAIAKGFGVDQIAGLLDRKGIAHYMVEIGGEIKTRGKNHMNQSWRIGIAAPISGKISIQKAVPLSNSAMATSGDYRNYFKRKGKRFSHTIDPRTGYPVTHNLASVTVIHDSCMVADALATAITVLGPEQGFQLALEEKLAIYLISRENNRFKETMTPQFNNFLYDKGANHQ